MPCLLQIDVKRISNALCQVIIREWLLQCLQLSGVARLRCSANQARASNNALTVMTHMHVHRAWHWAAATAAVTGSPSL